MNHHLEVCLSMSTLLDPDLFSFDTLFLASAEFRLIILVFLALPKGSMMADYEVDSSSSDGPEEESASTVHDTEMSDATAEDPESLVESWRQVHSHLVEAVQVARAAVAAKRAQRRFWLEEICGNLSESGKLLPTSVWKRPIAPKKTPAKKAAAAKKRKTKATEKPRKPRKKATKKETNEESPKPEDSNEHDEPQVSTKPPKIRLKLSKQLADDTKSASSQPNDSSDEESTTEEHGENEYRPTFAYEASDGEEDNEPNESVAQDPSQMSPGSPSEQDTPQNNGHWTSTHNSFVVSKLRVVF